MNSFLQTPVSHVQAATGPNSMMSTNLAVKALKPWAKPFPLFINYTMCLFQSRKADWQFSALKKMVYFLLFLKVAIFYLCRLHFNKLDNKTISFLFIDFYWALHFSLLPFLPFPSPSTLFLKRKNIVTKLREWQTSVMQHHKIGK